MTVAPINRIIDHSSVDGPGNRTVLFFQGCNFSCSYCHNPETIHMCTNCGACVALCPKDALRIDDSGNVTWDAAKCCGCDACIAACTQDASPKVTWMTPAEAVKRIAANRPFIRGITVSGGECSLRRDFVYEVFHEAKRMGLSTLMDTNGSYDFSQDPQLLEACDGVMLDVKCFDQTRHKELTGRTNETVLKSLDFLASAGKLEEVRTVIVPDALPNTDTLKRVCERLAPFWKQGSRIGYKLIRFRPVGVRSPYCKHAIPSEEMMENLRVLVEEAGCKRISVI